MLVGFQSSGKGQLAVVPDCMLYSYQLNDMANLDKNYDTALSAGMKESLMIKALSTLVPPLPSINTPLEPLGSLEILNPFIHTNHLTELKYFFHN